MKPNFKRPLLSIVLVLMLPLVTFGQNEEDSVKMGSYSVSLNVADISASLEFYQKLGFEPMEGQGSIEQKWMLLSNGDARIGLFQGMFPTNTMTFNPTNGRELYKEMTENGIESTFQIGMENESGPCTFSLLDPDGNPILIDQHK